MNNSNDIFPNLLHAFLSRQYGPTTANVLTYVAEEVLDVCMEQMEPTTPATAPPKRNRKRTKTLAAGAAGRAGCTRPVPPTSFTVPVAPSTTPTELRHVGTAADGTLIYG